MFSKKSLLNTLAAVATMMLITSCSDHEAVKPETQSEQAQAIVLDVYKSISCGCCKHWISHLNESGFQSKVHNSSNMSIIKERKGIAPRYRSCHTAISTAGFVFEGHIPAKFIQQFLTESHPNGVLGLSVPAMPVGSPGMEIGDKFQPYQVLLLKADGSHETYARVQSYKEQF
ncbi:MAG: DUF411 domain-containing protein [Colwellia sp.]